MAWIASPAPSRGGAAAAARWPSAGPLRAADGGGDSAAPAMSPEQEKFEKALEKMVKFSNKYAKVTDT